MTKRYLYLGPDLALPATDAQTQTIVVYGGKGMGKTNLAAVIAEEMATCRLRFSWLDPVGVAWGLKHSRDGRGSGVEVLVLGGAHGDLPIEPTGGEVCADLVVDEDVSVIIDVSRHATGKMWSQGEKIRFVRDYCLRLYQRQGERRRPVLQIIDEAGRFVPQQMPKGALDIAECVGAIEQMVELGRNVGVGVVLITQRSARMNKSVSELAEMMVAFRTVGPLSLQAIVDWFGEHVEKARWRELVERIRQLPRGTALVVSPGWLQLEGEFEVRARETFDSSATPVAGKERRPTGRGATIDSKKYRDRMAETVERAEAADPRVLTKRIRELEAELRKRPDAKPTVEIKHVQVPVLKDAQIQRLEKMAAQLAEQVHRRSQVEAAFAAIVTDLRDALAQIDQPKAPPAPTPAVRSADVPRPQAVPTTVRETDTSGDGEVKLKAGMRRMVETLVRHYPTKVTKAQLATLARMKVSGGTFGVYFATLQRAGLIVLQPDGLIALTQAGLDYVGHQPRAPLTPQEVLDQWRTALKAGARAMLDYVVERRGEWVTKSELAEAVGMAETGGTFGVYLGTLRRNGLVDVHGSQVRASETIWVGEAV